jgi:hypothetical protein
MGGKVLKIKKDVEIVKNIHLKSGQELEIVMGVVYMGGYPLPPEFQELFINFINNNSSLFEDDTRNW